MDLPRKSRKNTVNLTLLGDPKDENRHASEDLIVTN